MEPPRESTRPALLTPSRKNGPSLEEPALLPVHLGGWELKRYVTAGEAVIAYVRPSAERQPNALDPAPEASEREREAEYARRAAGAVRRWIRANRCAYMWTFT